MSQRSRERSNVSQRSRERSNVSHRSGSSVPEERQIGRSHEYSPNLVLSLTSSPAFRGATTHDL